MNDVPYYDPRSYRLPTGEDLRSIRERLGLSQRDAAEQAGIGSHRTVGRIENGSREGSVGTVRSLLDTYRILWTEDEDVDDVDDVDEPVSVDREPIETIAIPVGVAAKGKPSVTAYLFDRGYAASEIASLLDLSEQTARQYLSDVKAGRR